MKINEPHIAYVVGKRAAFIYAAMLLSILLGGCSLIYEDNDCPPGFRVETGVSANWLLSPGSKVEGMAFVFYPSASGKGHPWRFDFPGEYGGTVEIPMGLYCTVCFNDDSSRIIVEGIETAGTLRFTTADAGLHDGLGAANGTPIGPTLFRGERVAKSPDRLYVGYCSGYLLSSNTGSWCLPWGTDTISRPPWLILYPENKLGKIHVKASGIENLKSASAICAWISGMPGEVKAEPEGDVACVTLPFHMRKDGKETANGELSRFLPCVSPAKPTQNILGLLFRLSDGTEQTTLIDITNQITGAPDPADIYVEVKGIRLPDLGQPDEPGAFDVSVDGWDTIYIETGEPVIEPATDN